MAEKTRILVEIGSTHMGKISYVKEAIERCVEMDADAIKFQLFPNTPDYTKSGNVWLSPDLYLEAAEYANGCGLDCSASVFDRESFQFLLKTIPPFIKFSYSKKDQTDWLLEAMEDGIEAIVSSDIMTDYLVPAPATKLYCIPEYPVRYEISFDELFPRFHGFSDHTLGYRQTLLAVEAGATIIEKHMKLDHRDVTCPDAYFALSPLQMKNMIKSIRRGEL